MTPAMGLTTVLSALLLVPLFASAQEHRWLADGWQYARAPGSKFRAEDEGPATTTIAKTTITDTSGSPQTQNHQMPDRNENIRHENTILQPSRALGEKTEASLLGPSDAEQSLEGFEAAVSTTSPSDGEKIASYEKRFLKGRNKLLQQFMDTALEKVRAKDQTLLPSDRGPPVKRFLKASDYYLTTLAKHNQFKPPESVSLSEGNADFQNLENESENMSEKNFRRIQLGSGKEAKRFAFKMVDYVKDFEENKTPHLQHSFNQHQKIHDGKTRVLTNSKDPSTAKSMETESRHAMQTELSEDRKNPQEDEKELQLPAIGDCKGYSNDDRKETGGDQVLMHPPSSAPDSDNYIKVRAAQRRVRRQVGFSDEDSALADYSELDFPDQFDDAGHSSQSELPLDKRFLRGTNPYLRPYLRENPKKRFLKGFNPYWNSYRSRLHDRRAFSQPYPEVKKRFPSPVDLYFPTAGFDPQNERQDFDDRVHSEEHEDDGGVTDAVQTLRMDKRFVKGLNSYLALYSTRLPLRVTPAVEDDSNEIAFEKRFLRSPNSYLQSYVGRTTPKKKVSLVDWSGVKRSQRNGVWDPTQRSNNYFLDGDQRELANQFQPLDKRFLKGLNPYLHAHPGRGRGYWNSQFLDTHKRFEETEKYRQPSPLSLQGLFLTEDDGNVQSLREKRFMKGVNQYFLKLHRGKKLLDSPELYVQGRQLSRDAEPEVGEDGDDVWEDGYVIPVKKRFMRGPNQHLHSYNLNSKPHPASLNWLRQDVGDRLVLEITKPLRASLAGDGGLSPNARLGWELGHRLSSWPVLVSRQFYPSFG